jgi:hypothetical protein
MAFSGWDGDLPVLLGKLTSGGLRGDRGMSESARVAPARKRCEIAGHGGPRGVASNL